MGLWLMNGCFSFYHKVVPMRLWFVRVHFSLPQSRFDGTVNTITISIVP